MVDKFLKNIFNYTVLCSSGFLIMFIPKCSFPFFKDPSQEDIVRVYQRVIVDDPIDEELRRLEEEDNIILLDD